MSNDQRFTQWLQNYEAERIPDDMNLWNAIESQIKPVRRSTVFPRAALLVAVLMMILMTAGVYALDQIINNQVGDEGMNAVAEQGKIAELYITNDFGGEYELKVTLETIYADSNRVFVAMSASGTMPADNIINLRLNPRLILPNGDELPFLGFGGGGGGGGGGGEGGESQPNRLPFRMSTIMNYDSSIIQDVEELLALTIQTEISYTLMREHNTPHTNPSTVYMLGEVVYNVEIPFNMGIILTPNQSVAANNIEMRLQNVSITSSLTRLELCYLEPAHPEGDTSMSVARWLPVMSLSVGEETVFENQLVGLLPDDYNAETGCYTYNITFALDSYVGDWTLSVDRLIYQLTPPVLELQAAFDEAGLPATAMTEGGFSFDSTGLDEPEFLDLKEAVQAIYEQWQEKIEGAWTFTFTVP